MYMIAQSYPHLSDTISSRMKSSFYYLWDFRKLNNKNCLYFYKILSLIKKTRNASIGHRCCHFIIFVRKLKKNRTDKDISKYPFPLTVGA